MTVTGASINGVRVIAVRVLTANRGAWLADVDLDPTDPSAPPTGQVTIAIGNGATLVGTVDPRGSGRFASSVRQRIVAGGGGWDQTVSRQAFHADNGVLSKTVYEATAALVGETVNDPNPIAIGIDVPRTMGPASRVFGDRDWYVDVAGVTQIGPRPAVGPDATLEVLDFDPNEMRAELSCDALVLPGTVLTDARFDGSLVVRDVEQTFSKEGSRATVWFSSADVARLANSLINLVREASGRTFLRVYRYRYVGPNGATRVNLQAVDVAMGQPDLLAISVYPGMAGLSAKLTPAQVVLVAFLETSPGVRQPIVVGFDDNLPEDVTVDATDTVHIGPSAKTVNLAGDGGQPVARAGDAITSFFPPTMAVAGLLSGVPFTGVITIITPGSGIISTGSAKVNAK